MLKWILSLTFALSLAAQDPPENITWLTNVEYSSVGEPVQMDIAIPKSGAGPFPAVLCIHGGGFRAGSRDRYHDLVWKLAERGYVAATASYRLSPKYQFPAHVHDVKAAVRFLRARAKTYKLDPNRIGATGGSAGGTLVLMLGTTSDVAEFEGTGPNLAQSSAVQTVVNYYGATDFTESYGKSVDAHEVLPLYLGGNVEQARENHIRSSPLYWVTPNAAPTLTIHGTADRFVAYEQGVWIHDALKKNGVESELLTLTGADHGFRKPQYAKQAEEALFAWFDSHLK
jgi:acetyl esterase/lipase